MSRESQHIILNHLDNPGRVMIFTYDQVIAFIGVFLFMVLIFSSPEFGIVFGMLGMLGISKVRKILGKGYWDRLKYWYFPRSKKDMPYYIASHVREWIG
jgi:type IV conjugative transfer system protein TraL